MKYQDTEQFFNGHNMLLGDIPEKVSLKAICDKLKFQKSEIDKFGLFGTAIDFNTYYPDVKVEDLKPKKEDYAYPVFRALSETRVRPYFPVNFSKNGVLQQSQKKLVGQTVYANHEAGVGNGLGTVYEASWQESQDVDGFLVPAGINTVLQLDGKKSPGIVRGIQADPPEIHSTSVTVQFEWEQSHVNLTRDDFYRLVGTLDAQGNMIERMATNIIAYHEISLVSHGADPYAQQIKDGKIINPSYADTQKFSKEQKPSIYHFFDFKNLETETLSAEQFKKAIPEPSIIEQNDNKMNEALKKILEVLGKDATAFKPEDSTEVDALVASITSLKANKDKVESLTADLATSTAEVTRLKTENGTLEGFKVSAETALTDARNEATRLYNLTLESPEQSMLDLISKADYTGAKTFIASFQKTVEASLGGGRSSKHEGSEEGAGKEDTAPFKEKKSDEDVMASFLQTTQGGSEAIHGDIK